MPLPSILRISATHPTLRLLWLQGSSQPVGRSPGRPVGRRSRPARAPQVGLSAAPLQQGVQPAASSPLQHELRCEVRALAAHDGEQARERGRRRQGLLHQRTVASEAQPQRQRVAGAQHQACMEGGHSMGTPGRAQHQQQEQRQRAATARSRRPAALAAAPPTHRPGAVQAGGTPAPPPAGPPRRPGCRRRLAGRRGGAERGRKQGVERDGQQRGDGATLTRPAALAQRAPRLGCMLAASPPK